MVSLPDQSPKYPPASRRIGGKGPQSQGFMMGSSITSTLPVATRAWPSIQGSGISPPAGLGSGLFVAKKASNPKGAIEFIDYLLEESTARLIIEKLNVIPAQPVNPKGLEVPELFKEVLEDLSESPQAKSFGYNIDGLAPQSFNEVMYNGFRGVISGVRSPEEQAGALQRAWAEAKRAGKTPTQG